MKVVQGTRKAVILARGLGKRMRATSPSADLTPEQTRFAESGMKGMIPIGRPFLDYCMSALADAGCSELCLVIGPEHGAMREYYRALATERVTISFAIQERPMGTADALRAAEPFVDDQHFLLVNSDNLYPVEALRGLRRMERAGLVGFEKSGLIQNGNIDEGRIRTYAVLRVDHRNVLERIEEKPAELKAESALISMNCWSFTPLIFRASAAIGPSTRGEYEIPNAVQYAIEHLGESFQVLRFHGGVLDLSIRGDVASVTPFLKNCSVRL